MATSAKPPTASLSWTKLLPSSPYATALVSFPRRRNRSAKTVFVVAVSSGAKPTVLVAEKLGEAGISLLKEFANVDCSYNLTQEELCTKISLCDALIVRSGTKVTRDVFEASSGRLKVVGRAGVGIDNVDLAAATEHGCLVVNAPTANTIAAAEHGIALLAAMARNISQASESVKAGISLSLIKCVVVEIFCYGISFYSLLRTRNRLLLSSFPVTHFFEQVLW